jgi:hypothetical protein
MSASRYRLKFNNITDGRVAIVDAAGNELAVLFEGFDLVPRKAQPKRRAAR